MFKARGSLPCRRPGRKGHPSADGGCAGFLPDEDGFARARADCHWLLKQTPTEERAIQRTSSNPAEPFTSPPIH